MSPNEEVVSLQCNSFLRSGGEIFNPVFYLPRNLANIVGVKIKAVSIPLSVYTFDPRNSSGILYEPATSSSFPITLTAGNYTGTSLATELQTRLDGSGTTATYTVVYNLASNSLTISSTVSFSFSAVNNNFYSETGISTGINGTTYTTGSINLLGIQQLNISCNIGGQYVLGSNYRLLGQIPVEETQLTLATFSDNSSDYITSQIPNLSEITFKLFDSHFREVKITQDWSITVNLVLAV
jgi:hypothetical protein